MNSTDTPVLVLGATGHVGRGVVSGLAARGVPVRAATRSPGDASPGVALVRFDLADPSTFGPALDGAGALFVLAPPGVADAHGLLAPFLAQALPRVGRVVTMSAQGVDASEQIPLRRVELTVEASGTPYAHLRPTWFSDNFASYWWPSIEASGTIRLPAADSRTAFVDARDISASAVSLLVGEDDRLGRAWEITGPEALTYAEAAKVLSAAWDRPIRYQPVDDGAFIAGMEQAGLPSDYAHLLAGIFAGARAGGAARVTDDVRALTGRAPRSLEAWARAHAVRG